MRKVNECKLLMGKWMGASKVQAKGSLKRPLGTNTHSQLRFDRRGGSKVQD
ncbi:unnamed protein product, partial [marine sediment metagenome]